MSGWLLFLNKSKGVMNVNDFVCIHLYFNRLFPHHPGGKSIGALSF
jgi:hypothetical protein